MLLIDGDILVYKSISAAEQEIEFEEDIWTMMVNMADAKDNFVTSLAAILLKTEETAYHICLSDRKSNWRKQVYPEYKSNRKKTRLPMGFLEFRKWVKEHYPIVEKPSLEADDVMGIIATKPGNDARIWSEDKDLMTIPGTHWIRGELENISPAKADYYHMLQTLTGDAVDGYPGCKGVGPVKAAQLLVSPYWPCVVAAYEKAGLDEDFALTQARVARICRWDDWNMATQEVKLWQPTA